jgi:hypothetical protein
MAADGSIVESIEFGDIVGAGVPGKGVTAF